ncbi:MAG: hypothetical protein ACREFJ_12670 [Acetobacteraceae bacterium]
MANRITLSLLALTAVMALAGCQQPGEPLGATVNQDIHNAKRNLGLTPTPPPPTYAPAPTYAPPPAYTSPTY